MKTLLILMTLITSHWSWAQTSTNASGGEASGNGGSVSYSIGQIDYSSSQGNNGDVNEGVQQPYEFYSISVNEEIEEFVSISIYPNPTVNDVLISIDSDQFEDYTLQLIDSRGKQLSNQSITEENTVVKMSDVPSATYFLILREKGQTIQTIKIIKNQ